MSENNADTGLHRESHGSALRNGRVEEISETLEQLSINVAVSDTGNVLETSSQDDDTADDDTSDKEQDNKQLDTAQNDGKCTLLFSCF